MIPGWLWWGMIAFFVYVTIFGGLGIIGDLLTGIILGGPFLIFYLIAKGRERRLFRELQEEDDNSAEDDLCRTPILEEVGACPINPSPEAGPGLRPDEENQFVGQALGVCPSNVSPKADGARKTRLARYEPGITRTGS